MEQHTLVSVVRLLILHSGHGWVCAAVMLWTTFSCVPCVSGQRRSHHQRLKECSTSECSVWIGCSALLIILPSVVHGSVQINDWCPLNHHLHMPHTCPVGHTENRGCIYLQLQFQLKNYAVLCSFLRLLSHMTAFCSGVMLSLTATQTHKFGVPSDYNRTPTYKT